MKTFSLKRMGLLIQYYWRTEKAVVTTSFFMMSVLYLGNQVMNALSRRMMLPSSLLYWILVTAMVCHMFSPYHTKKESAIVSLTLPATNLEKYLSRVLYVSLGSMLMAAVAELCADLIAAGFALGMDRLAGNPYNPQILNHFLSLNDWTLLSRLTHEAPPLLMLKAVFYFCLLVLPSLSVFTLCGLLFHRWGYLIGTMLVVGFVFSQIAFGGLLHGPGTGDYWRCLLWFFAVVTVVCYGLGYRSFCRQQMRKRLIYI